MNDAWVRKIMGNNNNNTDIFNRNSSLKQATVQILG